MSCRIATPVGEWGTSLGPIDLYLHAEGAHLRSYHKIGAHQAVQAGVLGTSFVIWAPNARAVSVVGDFNDWDIARAPMSPRGETGLWETFLAEAMPGARYKFAITTSNGDLAFKADPYAMATEVPPRTASVISSPLPSPKLRHHTKSGRHDPISIYEVHLGSWRRMKSENNRSLSYLELAEQLVPYVKEMGFTHLEIMPIAEYPFEGSWGYQPISLFAPTARYGTPAQFQEFVQRCHDAGLGVILDWPAGHFPGDAHGLSRLDGTGLYEHEDPKLGLHPDWGSCVYNFGRHEVRNFLIANALFWLKEYGIDGLRVDAVASMLYRDYSRREGQWVPNAFGGRENLEAIAFIRRLNEIVYDQCPGAVTIAEESTAWPLVSHPTFSGGLGFGYKWNMGWMHDVLSYMGKDPIHRRHHHDKLTFGLLYAFRENFILPISHDEVVYGKGSLLGRMPGDEWQQFANLRAFLAFMFAHPGKKLLFMGCEFGQRSEWNHDGELDWGALANPGHAGIQALTRDLNLLYRNAPALHEHDCEPAGFSWISCADTDNSVIAFLRSAADSSDVAVAVCNFTPVPRENYRVGVPRAGFYRENINTDSHFYGGSDMGNGGGVWADAIPAHGFPCSLSLTLPPLAVLILTPGKA